MRGGGSIECSVRSHIQICILTRFIHYTITRANLSLKKKYNVMLFSNAGTGRGENKMYNIFSTKRLIGVKSQKHLSFLTYIYILTKNEQCKIN